MILSHILVFKGQIKISIIREEIGSERENRRYFGNINFKPVFQTFNLILHGHPGNDFDLDLKFIFKTSFGKSVWYHTSSKSQCEKSAQNLNFSNRENPGISCFFDVIINRVTGFRVNQAWFPVELLIATSRAEYYLDCQPGCAERVDYRLFLTDPVLGSGPAYYLLLMMEISMLLITNDGNWDTNYWQRTKLPHFSIVSRKIR